MGAGGKEMVFQCNSEWMASFYSKHAAYPNANVTLTPSLTPLTRAIPEVLANEVFSGVLWRTAATDFRTFLSHGTALGV
jgi:hypothetical protein